jgi:hypothetical protein
MIKLSSFFKKRKCIHPNRYRVSLRQFIGMTLPDNVDVFYCRKCRKRFTVTEGLTYNPEQK